ncbi:MAG: hypothetical protein K9N09_01415 [Candidatus Cloacimonetes bacterium]|nr:hypothetical protein [Candidatus Cloacimonadota bacterium]MCF7882766.1 hypothetical protein [Candidatus Cloacimonadota bacterium]
MKKIIILSAIAILFVSCIDFTSPQRYEEAQYYLTGMLYDNHYVDLENPVMFGRTIATDGDSLQDAIIPTAQIKLYEINSNDVTTDSTDLVFSFNPADLEEFGFVDLNQHLLIKSGFSYKIEANYEDETLWAVTTVPDPITVLPDPGYTADTLATGWPEMVYDTIDQEHPIMIETLNNDIVNLEVETYCLENWQDAEYITPFGDIEGPEEEEDYESPADGGPRRTRIFYTFQPENNVIDFGFYQYAFFFYGRYRVTVSSTDDNYLHYLYEPEGYNHGGINGGIGYFGSASSYEIYTKIIEEN